MAINEPHPFLSSSGCTGAELELAGGSLIGSDGCGATSELIGASLLEEIGGSLVSGLGGVGSSDG